jgi:hypothetical protein
MSTRSGLHSSANQSPYQGWSSALGRNYNIDEYVPFFNRSYIISSASGKAQYAADKAEAENIRRYYEILSGYRSLLDNTDTSVSSAYSKALASSLQNLTSRGLTGTTILNNATTMNAINKAMAQQSAYNQNLLNMLNFMERRNTSTGQLVK